MSENRHLAEPHPQWKEFPSNLPLNTAVKAMTRAHDPPKPEDGLVIDEFDNIRNGKEPIIVRRYRATKPVDQLPCLLYMHGGGFVTGGLETDDYMCRQIASQVPVVVLSVKYSLAPEYPFPAGWEDCMTVVRWLVNKEAQHMIGVDLDLGFVLGGTSAGGNFTAGLAHTILEEGIKPQPTGLLFMASSFCHPDVRPPQYKERILSIDEIDDAPGLTIKSIKYFAEKYGAPKDDKRYSPLLYESRKGLAQRAFFQICGWDPRRDEAMLYERLLEQEGLATKSKIYAGLPHGFWTTCPNLPESKQAIQDTVEGLRWLLTP